MGAGWAAALDFLPRRWRTMILGSWRLWDECWIGADGLCCKLAGDGVAWTLRGAKSGTQGTGRLHVLWRTWRSVQSVPAGRCLNGHDDFESLLADTASHHSLQLDATVRGMQRLKTKVKGAINSCSTVPKTPILCPRLKRRQMQAASCILNGRSIIRHSS